jgi:hypothetical protein
MIGGGNRRVKSVRLMLPDGVHCPRCMLARVQARPPWQAIAAGDKAAQQACGAAELYRQPGQDLTNTAHGRDGTAGKGIGGVKPHHTADALAAKYRQLSVAPDATTATVGRLVSGKRGSNGANAAAPLPAATAAAVREAAEQLEEVRRAAMHQALAARQQRLASGAPRPM